MTRSITAPLQRTTGNPTLMAAAVAIVFQLSPAIAHAFPHFTTLDSGRWHYFTPAGDAATVVSAIAVEGVSETGEADGGAAFQYLESGRPGRHLQIEAEIRGAQFSFDNQGDVVGLILTGVATVTGDSAQTEEVRFTEWIGPSDGLLVLDRNDSELSIETGPPGGRIAVETAGRLETAVALTAVRTAEYGALDWIAVGAASTTGEGVGGSIDVGVLSTDTPFFARGDVTRLRSRSGDFGAAFALDGMTTVQARDGECNGRSMIGLFLPSDERLPAVASFLAPGCGVSGETWSTSGGGYLGWATFPD